MGNLHEDIKQKHFKDEFSKSMINLIYTSNYFYHKQSPMFKKHGLSVPQFNILRILRGQYPNASTVNLLIDRMLDKSSNASRIVDKLEDKKLVIRKQCPDDRRAVDVFISEKGMELLARLDREMDEWQTRNQTLNEEECRQLNRLLDKMRS